MVSPSLPRESLTRESLTRESLTRESLARESLTRESLPRESLARAPRPAGRPAVPNVQKVVCRGRDREKALQELMRNYRPEQILSAKPELVGGVLGFFQHEALVVTVDDTAAPPPEAPARHVALRPLDAVLEGTRDEVSLGGLSLDDLPETVKTFSQVLGEVVSSLGEEPGEYRPGTEHLRGTGSPAPAAPAPAAEVHAPAPAPAAPAPAAAPHDPAPPAPAASTPAAEAHDPAASTPAPSTPAEARARWAVVCDVARSCGVPGSLIPASVPDGEEPRLQAIFSRLPEPPPLPDTSGGLVAVVGCSMRGEGKLSGLLGAACAVRPTARAIARTVGCAPEDIALVCEALPDRSTPPGMSAHNPRQAASFAPGWRRDKVGVAAVYAPPLGEDQEWARAVLKALRPSSVVAVVSATTKPEDVARWVQAIGGADALAVVEVRGTCTPGAVLSTGIPVRSLDGEAATPAQWAAVCAARS